MSNFFFVSEIQVAITIKEYGIDKLN